MKALSKAVAIASLVSAGALTTHAAQAEVSFNAALVTDYVWRGTTQSDNSPAIQGGADIDLGSGLAVGIWGSTIDFGTDDNVEVDVYGSYSFSASGLDMSAAFYSYNYDGETDTSYEAAFGVEKDAVAATVYVAVNADDGAGYTYLEGAYGMELPSELALDLTLGYALPEEGDNIMDLSATVGKSLEMLDVAATVTYTDLEFAEDDVLFFLTASKEF